jgi:hypothetical protein
MNSGERYLNVQYGSLTAEVDITGKSRLGGVQDAIKQKLGEVIPVAAALIQLYTNSNRDQQITTWANLNYLPEEYFVEGGSCVVVGTSPLIIKRNDDSTNLHSLMFYNQNEVAMSTKDLYDWLCGSNTNSETDLTQNQVSFEAKINSNNQIVFPLAGRDESLEHIKNCFLTSFENRSDMDRNSRPIPVCTGIPGLGKTRLMEECATTVLDMTQILGQRISGIVSFGNDGNAYSSLDDILGIQCSFAWRVLHMFFKAHHFNFELWMRNKSPKNRNMLTLRLALSVIEFHWSQKTEDNILVFVGIDEYQKLGQDKLNALLGSLCDCSRSSTQSKLSFFCMLAGTDLNMTRIARTSFPNTQRTPIRFLTHKESMAAIGPYLSKFHSGFVGNEAFAQNVFFLGGVPRLLTEFANRVAKIPAEDMTENHLGSVRMEVLSNLQYPQLSFSDTLRLLAISFTNTPVLRVMDIPFPNSNRASDLTWSQLISNGMCLLQDNGCVIVPYHLVVQVVGIQAFQLSELNECEKALVLSLKDLSNNVEKSGHNLPDWLSWESFGARFYSIRINSFLVLGQTQVNFSSLIRGSRFSEGEFEVVVRLKIAKVIYSKEQFGRYMPQIININGNYHPVDWVYSNYVHVVLNGVNGPGVDVFFTLERADNKGLILLLDQRKRYSSNITNSVISTMKSRIPAFPECIKVPLVMVFGVMSIYSQINIEDIPKSTFIVSSSDSPLFHGSIFDHPGCSLKIDVNTATSTALCQIYGGSGRKRKMLADQTIERRKLAKIVDVDALKSFILTFEGELDELAIGRICF